MKKFKYIIYKEGKYFVSQCLNVDISSFGETVDKAVKNLKEKGFSFVSQKGSHKKFRKEKYVVVVPDPKKEIPNRKH